MKQSVTALELKPGDKMKCFIPSLYPEDLIVTIDSTELCTFDGYKVKVCTTNGLRFKFSASQHCSIERES